MLVLYINIYYIVYYIFIVSAGTATELAPSTGNIYNANALQIYAYRIFHPNFLLKIYTHVNRFF